MLNPRLYAAVSSVTLASVPSVTIAQPEPGMRQTVSAWTSGSMRSFSVIPSHKLGALLIEVPNRSAATETFSTAHLSVQRTLSRSEVGALRAALFKSVKVREVLTRG